MATACHYCVYKNCTHNNRVDRYLTFFKFPVSDVKRARLWQRNCGNPSIELLEVANLKNKIVCEMHFSSNHIIKNDKRKLLTKTAVPIEFVESDSEGSDYFPLASAGAVQDLDIGEHSKTYGIKRVNSETDLDTAIDIKYLEFPNIEAENNYPGSKSSSPSSNLGDYILQKESPTKYVITKKTNTLNYKVDNLKKKNLANRPRSYKFKTKTSFSATLLLLNLLIHRNRSVKTFVNMQLFHRKNKNWTREEQQLALSLYHTSPVAYKFMLYSLKFVLPSLKTIRSWLKVCNLMAGLNTALIDKLSFKAKTMTDEEKKVVVMFDEIKLKSQLEFDQIQDRIEGYEDLGSLGRCAKLANTGLVFLIRGVLHNWKIPLCFYVFAGPLSSTSLYKIIIIDVIKKLKEMTFTPLVLVSNQESNSGKVMELLGATKEKPMVEIEGQKIFTCFDTSHLLISLRNSFMNRRSQFLIDKIPIAWRDIIQTYEMDKKIPRAMPKITDAHIWPTNFQKTCVKYAAQIFSHTVAAAIQTAFRLRHITTSTALHTAEFIKKVNNTFDALNSRILNDTHPYRRALSIFNESTLNLLYDALDYFKTIEIFENNQVKNISCIHGFQWTINSILQLWNHLKDCGTKYLCTGFLSRDDLENLFSVARHRGGYTPTPSVRQFRIAMQHNMNTGLQRNVETENREVQDEEIRTIDNEENDETKNTFKPTGVSGEQPTRNGNDMEIDINLSLDACSAVYVAGFLAYKVEQKYNCNKCSSILTQNENELTNAVELFLLFKDYRLQNQITCLKGPSEQFSEIVKSLLDEFNEAFNIYKCGNSVSKNIDQYLKNYLSNNYCAWYESQSQSSCRDHMQYMLSLFIKMNILRSLRWESRNIDSKQKEETLKPHRKIRILQT